jgi:hypothetical protein
LEGGGSLPSLVVLVELEQDEEDLRLVKGFLIIARDMVVVDVELN